MNLNMDLLIATVFAVITIAQARHYPSVELYEIRDQSETRSRTHEPVLQRIKQLDSKTDAATIAKYIAKYWKLLKPGHAHNHEKSENEGGFVDETRSSIVVLPGDRDLLNNIMKLTNYKADGNSKIYQLIRAFSKDNKSYGKRTKRVGFEPQWEIPVKSYSQR